MTVKKALAEIEELRPTCDGSKARILEEYKAYLLGEYKRAGLAA